MISGTTGINSPNANNPAHPVTDPRQYQCLIKDSEFDYSNINGGKCSNLLLPDIDKQQSTRSFQDARNEINNAHNVESRVRIAAINEINHMEALVYSQEISSDKTALKNVAQKLDKFITDYPWAGTAFTALRIGASALTGPAGFVAASVNELKSVAVGELALPAVSVVIVESAKRIKVYDPSLTDQEAIVLASSLLAMSGFVADAKSVFGSMKSVIKNVHLDGGLAYATAGGGKFKLDTDADIDGSNSFFRKADVPDTVVQVGGRNPIKAEYAGKVYHADDLPDSIKNIYPDIKIKYPDGVKYDVQGFPDFKPYTIKEVKLEKFTPGNHRKDYDRATLEVRKADPNFVKPKDYTWHHHQDGTTMQLVPGDLHKDFQHTGGMSTTKHGVNKK